MAMSPGVIGAPAGDDWAMEEPAGAPVAPGR